MTTLILQSIIGIVLAAVAFCAARKNCVITVKIALYFTSIAAIGMSFIISSQFLGYTYLYYRDLYRIFVFVVTTTELTVILSLREYSSWT